MIACRSVRYSFLDRINRLKEGKAARAERERDDSVVNSMETRVNSFSFLTAVTAAMNGRFVYRPPLGGTQHM